MVGLKYANFDLSMVDTKIVDTHCLFIGVSGAHSFGWVTPKSDLDLRFVFFPDIGQLVSPFFPCRTKSSVYENIDIVEYPIGHFLQLLNKGNGNALDNLFEPKIKEQKELVTSLQKIVQENIHKGFIGHCLGYSSHIRKDFDIPSRLEKYGIEKLLLCRYRVLLQGFNLLSGLIDYNLPKLLQRFGTQYGEAVLKTYVEDRGTNGSIISGAMTETDNLHAQLGEALEKSGVPTFHQSGLVIHLDRWLRQKYLGKLQGIDEIKCFSQKERIEQK